MSVWKTTLLMVGMSAVFGGSAFGFLVEAETYGTSYNAGGYAITKVACSGASGGWAVDGFDTAGDWIQIALSVPEAYGYLDSLRSAGYEGYESDLRATIFGAGWGGSDLTSDYHTVGLGIS